MKKILLMLSVLMFCSMLVIGSESSISFMNQTYTLKMDKKIGDNGYIRTYVPANGGENAKKGIATGRFSMSDLGKGNIFQEEMNKVTKNAINSSQTESDSTIIWKKFDMSMTNPGSIITGACTKGGTSSKDIVCIYSKMGMGNRDYTLMFNYSVRYDSNEQLPNFDSEYAKIKPFLQNIN